MIYRSFSEIYLGIKLNFLYQEQVDIAKGSEKKKKVDSIYKSLLPHKMTTNFT